jgi:pilus assembly protein TadC
MAKKDLLTQLGSSIHRMAGEGLDDFVDAQQGYIVAAGMEDKVDGDKLLGIQLLSSLLFPMVVVFIIRYFNMMEGLFQGPGQIVLYLVLIAFGFYFPLMNVKERMAKRQKAILLALPDVIDLLTISVEAGLDFMGATRRVMAKIPQGPLREEFENFFKQVELGKTRQDALKDLSNRVQLVDLSTICSSLIQADRLGSSVGPILRIQSDMLRARRGQRAEKSAMEAPVKMLAPLLICIFPSVFIMLFAPLFIQMAKDLAAQ